MQILMNKNKRREMGEKMSQLKIAVVEVVGETLTTGGLLFREGSNYFVFTFGLGWFPLKGLAVG